MGWLDGRIVGRCIDGGYRGMRTNRWLKWHGGGMKMNRWLGWRGVRHEGVLRGT